MEEEARGMDIILHMRGLRPKKANQIPVIKTGERVLIDGAIYEVVAGLTGPYIKRVAKKVA